MQRLWYGSFFCIAVLYPEELPPMFLSPYCGVRRLLYTWSLSSHLTSHKDPHPALCLRDVILHGLSYLTQDGNATSHCSYDSLYFVSSRKWMIGASHIVLHINGGREKGYPPFFNRKMLSRKLYTTNKIPHQARTAICCFRESAMRGTLTVKAMVQKARNPSVTPTIRKTNPCRLRVKGSNSKKNLHMAAIIWVSRPSWLWKFPVKYVIPPRPSPATYGTLRMWLNMCPLTNSRIKTRLKVAQTFRFCTIGMM